MQESSNEEPEWVDSQESQNKKNIRKRIFVLSLMVYLAVMVSVSRWGVIGNLFDGYSWRSGGFGLFPIPYDASWFGYGTLPVEVPLNPVELLIYLIFIAHEIWIFWMILGAIYILLPWSSHLQKVVNRMRHSFSKLNKGTKRVSSREHQDKTNIGRRIFILLLLVYFATMVNVARGVISLRFSDFY